MWCDASGSGSVASELTWWPEPGMMHHLDQTLISRLQIREWEEDRTEWEVTKSAARDIRINKRHIYDINLDFWLVIRCHI